MHSEQKLTFWDRIMMAVTFAEANEAETARAILDKPQRKRLGRKIEKQNEQRAELRL